MCWQISWKHFIQYGKVFKSTYVYEKKIYSLFRVIGHLETIWHCGHPHLMQLAIHAPVGTGLLCPLLAVISPPGMGSQSPPLAIGNACPRRDRVTMSPIGSDKPPRDGVIIPTYFSYGFLGSHVTSWMFPQSMRGLQFGFLRTHRVERPGNTLDPFKDNLGIVYWMLTHYWGW